MRNRFSAVAIIAIFVLSVVTTGCSRKPEPETLPRTYDDPLGPIVKTAEPMPAGLPPITHEGPFVSYFANGFAKVATAEDRRAGRSQVRFYNPMNVENEVKVIVYFDNRPPEELTHFTMKPNNNDPLLTIPAGFLNFFKGSEAWGARIESTQPVIVLNVLAAGIISPHGDLWFGDPRYKGANVVGHATRRLEKRWLFGDGLVLKNEKETSTQRFNEYEWYHVLNPNPKAVEVQMHCNYMTGDSEVFSFSVKGERVRIIENKDMVRPNAPHAVEFTSSEPVLVTAERFIFDFKNTEDWGAWLHANHEGIPEPEIAGGGH